MLAARRGLPENRTQMLDAAAAARASRDFDEALRTYERWLQEHPDDHEVHGKAAPVYLEVRQPEVAWHHFLVAANGYEAVGFADKALSVMKQAVIALPGVLEAAERTVGLLLLRGRRADALRVLLDARAHARGREQLEDARRLLERAHEIDPRRTEVVLDLASVLIRLDERFAAVSLLQAHVEVCAPTERRRVRGALLRCAPSLGALWRWLLAP